MKILADQTTGHVHAPDGTVRALPAAILSADEAKTIRTYAHWCEAMRLEPELFCLDCWDWVTRDDRMHVSIEPHVVTPLCSCRMLHAACDPLVPVSVPPPPTFKSESAFWLTGNAAEVDIGLEASTLLRTYKKLLIKHRLVEALRCGTCRTLNLRDGCRAVVTADLIRIECRCCKRTGCAEVL